MHDFLFLGAGFDRWEQLLRRVNLTVEGAGPILALNVSEQHRTAHAEALIRHVRLGLFG